MAGMFSMLNNHMNGEGGQSMAATSSRDNAILGRNAGHLANQGNNNRRNQRPEFNRSSFKAGKGRQPQSINGKQRKFELHPMVRRGICTVITAGVVFVIGVLLLVADILKQKPPSIAGWIIVSVASLFIIVGIAWTRLSHIRLERLKKARKEIGLKKMRRQMERYGESNLVPMMVTSQHAIQWPSKKACPSQTCNRNTKISANGNHFERADEHSSSTSDCESDCLPTKPKMTSHSPTCDHEINKKFHRSDEYPLRITKHGKLNPIPPAEYMQRAWYTSTNEDTIFSCAKHSNLTRKYITNAM